MTKGKLFISHAAADKKLADHLVDLLQTGVDVPRGQIFCTSLEGMGVPKGTTFVEWIRQELVDATLVIALVTPSYFDSVFCLCELGATWATQTGFYPLIVPPVAYEDLKAVLVGCHVGVADDESDLDDRTRKRRRRRQRVRRRRAGTRRSGPSSRGSAASRRLRPARDPRWPKRIDCATPSRPSKQSLQRRPKRSTTRLT